MRIGTMQSYACFGEEKILIVRSPQFSIDFIVLKVKVNICSWIFSYLQQPKKEEKIRGGYKIQRSLDFELIEQFAYLVMMGS